MALGLLGCTNREWLGGELNEDFFDDGNVGRDGFFQQARGQTAAYSWN